MVTLLHRVANFGGAFLVCGLVGAFAVYAFWYNMDARVLSQAVYAEVRVSCMVLGADGT